MHATEIAFQARIAALVKKASSTDEAEKNEPDLHIPAEIERRPARVLAIEAAMAHLKERQGQADTQRARSDGVERRSKGEEGKPKGGKPNQREFGVPPAKAQDSFTDPESHIMKRAGGGFDDSYKAQTAMDEAHPIIVAAEEVNTNSDTQQLPMVLAAIKAHAESNATQVLSDAGYRREEVMAKLAQALPDIELVIAPGRGGKE